MFNYKFKLYSISLIVVWAVLLVKTVDIPIYIGPDDGVVSYLISDNVYYLKK